MLQTLTVAIDPEIPTKSNSLLKLPEELFSQHKHVSGSYRRMKASLQCFQRRSLSFSSVQMTDVAFIQMSSWFSERKQESTHTGTNCSVKMCACVFSEGLSLPLWVWGSVPRGPPRGLQREEQKNLPDREGGLLQRHTACQQHANMSMTCGTCSFKDHFVSTDLIYCKIVFCNDRKLLLAQH